MGQGYGRDWVSAVPGAIVCRRNGGDHGRRGGSTRYIVVEVKDGMGTEGDGGNEGLECRSIFMWSDSLAGIILIDEYLIDI